MRMEIGRTSVFRRFWRYLKIPGVLTRDLSIFWEQDFRRLSGRLYAIYRLASAGLMAISRGMSARRQPCGRLPAPARLIGSRLSFPVIGSCVRPVISPATDGADRSRRRCSRERRVAVKWERRRLHCNQDTSPTSQDLQSSRRAVNPASDRRNSIMVMDNKVPLRACLRSPPEAF